MGMRIPISPKGRAAANRPSLRSAPPRSAARRSVALRIDAERYAALSAAAKAVAVSRERLLAEALDAHLARLPGEPPRLTWPPRSRRKEI